MKKLFFIAAILCSAGNTFAQGSASCATAVPVGTGMHTSDNSQGSQWFAYTNSGTVAEIVKVSSCGYTTEDTFVGGSFQCGGLAAKANDDACGAQSEIELTVEPSRTVLIEWRALYTSAAFQWALTATPVQAGDMCSIPKTITPGLNTPDKPGKPQWYSYTNQSSGEQVISLIGDDANVLIFYSSCEQPFASGIQYDYLIAPGDSLLVMCEGSGSWLFEVRTPQTGDRCDMPQPAVAGANIPNFYSNAQWFVFTNTAGTEKVVETSIRADLNYILLYDECGKELPLQHSTHGYLSYITAPGQTLLFSTSYTDVFEINVRDIAPGDYCSNPIRGQEGINFNSNLGMDLWYAYTNTTGETREVTVATNEDPFIRVYRGCNDSRSQTVQYDFTETLLPDETIYFLMGRAEIYSIDIGNELQGDRCENPVPARYGINYPNKVMQEQWFDYTNETEETEYLHIDNGGYWTHDLLNKFALLADCDQEVPYLSRSSSGVVALSPGQSMFIHWFNVSNWTMSPYTPAEGEVCASAQSLAPGMHEADNQEGDHWYVYRNETSEPQYAEISSCELTTSDTYVALYSDCKGTELAKNDDDCSLQSRLNYTIMPGETVYICWQNLYNRATYTWKFDIDNVLSLNPAGKEAVLVYPTSSGGTYNFSETVESVTIYNSVGVFIKNTGNTRSVNIGDCPPGIYFLKFTTGNQTQTVRVLKS